MSKHVDILISDDGIHLDDFGFPALISGRASIAQDIKHMIRETGLLILMIGERHAETVRGYLVQIETKIEDDLRIVPGSARVERVDTNTIFVTAKTTEYGDIEMGVTP